MALPSGPSFADELSILVRARHPVIWITTHEEVRVLNHAYQIAQKPVPSDPDAPPKLVYLWSLSQGLHEVVVDSKLHVTTKPIDADMGDPIAAIRHAMEGAAEKTEEGQTVTNSGRIYVFRDLHRFLDNPAVYRFLRDAANSLIRTKTTILVTSPVSEIPVELQKDVIIVDVPLPNAEELRLRLDDAVRVTPKGVEVPKKPEEIERILKAGLGLTEEEFASAVKESIIRFRKVDPRAIVRSKEQIIRKSGVLELFQQVEGLDGVGGLDRLKSWIRGRSVAFTDKAAKFGLRAPRGLLLSGPPGTGKTLTAKAAAAELSVPLLRVNASNIFSKYVGDSEQNIRKILQTAEAIAPAILFIDEAEKLLAGSGGSGNEDSGTTRRVFGSLLSWMAERTAPVVVIATVNDPTRIAPELMRRFDAVFYVDLPNVEERKDVFAVQIRRLQRDPKKFDLAALAAATPQWSGSEIEQVLNEALFGAFAEGKELETRHVLALTKSRTPIAVSRKEEIERMRVWAKQNAIPASTPTESATDAPTLEA